MTTPAARRSRLTDHGSPAEIRSELAHAEVDLLRAERHVRYLKDLLDLRDPPRRPRTHHEAYRLADQIPTCRMAWMDAGDGPFGSRAVPENQGMQRARVGQQRGTYYKTSLTRDGMTVWNWGRVHPADRANGVCAS
jgi:hypothetical protein